MAKKAAYRKKRQNRMAMILVTIVVLMMFVVVAVKSVELREKKEFYELRVAQLQEEIDAEMARTEEIEEYGKYTQTKKYVEEVAKDKLGLVYEGEIIFKDEN
ncbi:MAG: septum formation initiator family protein [Lachnospiraceae bacterium]|nr:septum formation initiator family protein [Lachnospiraceae bacterium]